jgi:colanic acid/amylovoran biosynthesis glycosyltransferase
VNTCAIVAPEAGVYSETFIRDHIERMPCNVVPVYGTAWQAMFGSEYIVPKPVRYGAALGRMRRVPPWMSKLTANRTNAALAEFWKRNNVEVVMAEYAPTGVWLRESTQKAQVPLVVHFHGYDIYRNDTLEQYKSEYVELFQSAAAFIVGSRDMLAHAASLGVPEDRLYYNPCGVDISQFQPVDAGENPPVIAAVGRFVEKKAPYITILAFYRAFMEYPDARLVMAGDGPLLDTCKQMVRALHLDGAVEFLGRQNQEQVTALLQNSRAFAQHSVTALSGDSEGTAITVLEAAACGLPVLATRHSGIKDTMVDGETGFLVDELDIAGMAEAMRRVLYDRPLARRLGMNARERVAQHFTMEASIAGLHSILSQAASRRA